MYVKAESYGFKQYDEIIAYVLIKINPFTLKLKAEVEMKNGNKFVLKSNGETNDDFKEIVHDEIRKRMFL